MRADKYFAERFSSRTKAQEILRKGLVRADGKVLRPKDGVSGNERFEFLAEEERFVSNGGRKLAHALDVFSERVEGETAADLGASTGGFTDCLLQRGAARMFCVDVGESQLAPSLSADRRIAVLDRTNARYLKKDDFPAPLSVVTGDLSFISLRLILPAVYRILSENGRAFLLFKPQFECEGKGLPPSGILPQRYHAELLGKFYDFASEQGFFVQNAVAAPPVPKKNIEYVLFLKKQPPAVGREEFLRLAADMR